MGILDFLFGSSQVEEPNGKTDWLGNRVGSPESRGGSNGNEWWSAEGQADIAKNEPQGFDGWF